MMYRRPRGPGRVKIKLAEILRAHGFDVSPYDLWDAKGHWRTSPYADVYRWTGAGKRNGATVSFVSWDTMSACSRGVEVERDGFDWEVWAKE